MIRSKGADMTTQFTGVAELHRESRNLVRTRHELVPNPRIYAWVWKTPIEEPFTGPNADKLKTQLTAPIALGLDEDGKPESTTHLKEILTEVRTDFEEQDSPTDWSCKFEYDSWLIQCYRRTTLIHLSIKETS